ncbi:MAG: hypothetical protein JWM33_238 [Caulobacteraceae bacterium]|nr:hypothetical protein [Caulobacteraceae bacterium]
MGHRRPQFGDNRSAQNPATGIRAIDEHIRSCPEAFKAPVLYLWIFLIRPDAVRAPVATPAA